MTNSNNIPTGGAPLFLGSFASQRGAMAQKMTDRMIQLAEKEKTRQGQERADMLKALSFDAVQGLGRKVQEEHMAELEGLQDKWAKKWIQNGRKLTDRDYMELQRDKTDMAQRIANMKNNVAQYAKYSQDVMENPQLYHPSTVTGLQQYYKEGDVGKDLTPLVRHIPDTQKYLVDAFGALRTTKASETKVFNPETKMFDITSTNEPEIRRKVYAGLKDNPYYQELQKDPYVKKQADAQVENFISSIATKATKEEVPTEGFFKRQKIQAMPAKYQKAVSEYGWEDLSEEEVANAMYFNDFAKRILNHDKKAIDLLMSKKIIGGKTPSKYEIERDGGITLYGQPYKDGKMDTYYIPPADKDDPDNMRQAMTAVLDLAPASMQGKQKPDNIQRIITPEYKVDVKEKAPITAVGKLQDALSYPGNTKEDYGKEARTTMQSWIKNLLPNSKVEAKTTINWTGSSRPIKVDDTEYNLANTEDRQKLMDKVTTDLSIESIALPGSKKKKEATPVPAEEEVDYSVKIPDSSRIASEHNNPGNLIYANQPGAEKGEAKEGGGYWAKFKTPEEGFKQLERQINLDKERDITLGKFISKYAPPSENETANYLKYLISRIGDVTKDTKLSEIDTKTLAEAIAQKESGTTIGEPESVSEKKNITQEEYEKLKPGETYWFDGKELTKE